MALLRLSRASLCEQMHDRPRDLVQAQNGRQGNSPRNCLLFAAHKNVRLRPGLEELLCEALCGLRDAVDLVQDVSLTGQEEIASNLDFDHSSSLKGGIAVGVIPLFQLRLFWSGQLIVRGSRIIPRGRLGLLMQFPLCGIASWFVWRMIGYRHFGLTRFRHRRRFPAHTLLDRLLHSENARSKTGQKCHAKVVAPR